MVDNNTGKPDVSSRSPHDQEMVNEPRLELALTARAPIALSDMLVETLPSHVHLGQWEGMYRNLAQMPLTVFSVNKDSGEQDFVMVGSNLTAEQVNGLLYFAAPYKGFGFDTQDIINDWNDLYNDPAHANRRKAHAAMPGWNQYEGSRGRVLGVLERNFKGGGFNDQNTNDVVIPVLRWRQNEEGENEIILEPVDRGLQAALAKALPEQIQDTDRLDSGMGLMFIAAYSPQHTKWPASDGYKHSESAHTQLIGPTQVLAYAYRKVVEKQMAPRQVPDTQDLQKSELLTGLGLYAVTGEIPTISIPDIPADNLPASELSGLEVKKIVPVFPLSGLFPENEFYPKQQGFSQLGIYQSAIDHYSKNIPIFDKPKQPENEVYKKNLLSYYKDTNNKDN